ncbi:glutathione S-transferase [Pseudooceanicola sp. GBMRC 2024]|uniref:Glutathione S-transferase n=1 Tax=Pseudooceanicola albus TaxID=2692189 RepID=A0A6L7G1C0_9RHOB|nr:glutathione S-transferase family protein [Pseudooceanicola albus]MXN17729.1 glutathione S-transferase [Pseudooceanicola albus]
MDLKLFHAAASPFVRKVVVAARERGLFERLELIAAAPLPIRRDPQVARHNPSGKIPCLLLPDGSALFDSRVITAWIDAQGQDGEALYPVEGEARFRVLTLEALADSILDAAILLRSEETLRPEPLRWPDWSAGQAAKITAGLDALERSWGPCLGQSFHAGAIATACALGYLDFRLPGMEWRSGRPALAGWYEQILVRPSMRLSDPALAAVA